MQGEGIQGRVGVCKVGWGSAEYGGVRSTVAECRERWGSAWWGEGMRVG